MKRAERGPGSRELNSTYRTRRFRPRKVIVLNIRTLGSLKQMTEAINYKEFENEGLSPSDQRVWK